jgi:hypothetical protein
MTSANLRLVFADSTIEADYLTQQSRATADLSSSIHALYGVGWALAGLRLCSQLAR